MTTPAVELAQFLADNGIGQRGGDTQWSVHVSREPAAPDDVVTLYDTGGGEPPSINSNLREFALQVRVRSTDYVAGIARHQLIFNLFAQPDAVTLGVALERNIGANRYVGIWVTGEVTHIGRDENDRFLLTANYELHRKPL